MSKRCAMWSLAALAALALVAAGCHGKGSGSVKSVYRVVDGDTVVLSSGEQVRLAGCDAPAKGKPGWDRSRNELQRLLGGHRVAIERQGKDAQGRTLARVYLRDGRDVSELLIAKGLAEPWAGPTHSGSGATPEPQVQPAGK